MSFNESIEEDATWFNGLSVDVGEEESGAVV